MKKLFILVMLLAFVLTSPLVAYSPGGDIGPPMVTAAVTTERNFIVDLSFTPLGYYFMIDKPAFVREGTSETPMICTKPVVSSTTLADLMCGGAYLYTSHYAHIAMDNYVRFDPRSRMQALARDETFRA